MFDTRTATLKDDSAARKAEPARTQRRRSRAVSPGGEPGRQIGTVVHPAVYAVAVAAYVWFLGAFGLVLWGSAEAMFMVVVSALFVAVYVGVPGLLLAVWTNAADEARRAPRGVFGTRSFSAFLKGEIDTWTGPMSGLSAFVQIAMIPIAAAFLATVMASTIAVVG